LVFVCCAERRLSLLSQRNRGLLAFAQVFGLADLAPLAAPALERAIGESLVQARRSLGLDETPVCLSKLGPEHAVKHRFQEGFDILVVRNEQWGRQ
jgi:hypothetical protein